MPRLSAIMVTWLLCDFLSFPDWLGPAWAGRYWFMLLFTWDLSIIACIYDDILLPLWFYRQYPWSLRHFRSVRIASLCLQLVYYMLFTLHNRVGPNVLSWRYVTDLALRNWSLSPWSLGHSVRIAHSACSWCIICCSLFMIGWVRTCYLGVT